MIAVIEYCLTIAWAASVITGEGWSFAGCDFYFDGELHQSGVMENQASVCLEDFEPHVAEVTCFARKPDGTVAASPMSDASEPFKIEFKHPAGVGRKLTACEQADIDWNGTVGYLDFGKLITCFGEQHD